MIKYGPQLCKKIKTFHTLNTRCQHSVNYASGNTRGRNFRQNKSPHTKIAMCEALGGIVFINVTVMQNVGTKEAQSRKWMQEIPATVAKWIFFHRVQRQVCLFNLPGIRCCVMKEYTLTWLRDITPWPPTFIICLHLAPTEKRFGHPGPGLDYACAFTFSRRQNGQHLVCAYNHC